MFQEAIFSTLFHAIFWGQSLHHNIIESGNATGGNYKKHQHGSLEGSRLFVKL
jgi:hypothetical protein